VGPKGRVFGFDPDRRHIAISRDNAIRNKLSDRMHFVVAGVSDVASRPDKEADIENSGFVNAGRPLLPEDNSITIDSFCAEQNVGRVDYIKMDIEGSELRALRGAHKTIQRWRPKLAVCVYHKESDLWRITNLVREKFPFYRLVLGHHSLHEEETVLYAVAQDMY
jgi:FkbM family methyltransferase